MKPTFNFCLLIFVISISCTKEIEFKTKQIPSKLVLNSLLSADRLINVHLSQTVPLFNDSIPFIENARVELFENDSLVDVLASMGEGMYTSRIYAREGYYYKIKATSPGFEEVSGEDYVPELVPIISATADYGLFLYDFQGEIRYGIDFVTSIQDSPGTDNYYEIIFANKRLKSGRYSLDIYNSYVNPDPLFSTEDYFGYTPNQFLFSDSYFSGLQKDIRMKMESSYYFPDRNSSLGYLPEGMNIVLRAVSENYYLFFKSWIKHQYNLQVSVSIDEAIYEGLTGDPVPLFSNVTNGYGIVAAYTQTYYNTELIDHTQK